MPTAARSRNNQEHTPLPYLKVTESLDYLWCKIYSNYGVTRRENGEVLKKKIRDQVNSWKSGKFLPLILRSWSLNTYCLPKLWYRTACLDLRVGDSTSIASSVKSWLYQDLLLKPQEIMMYRGEELGGLGVTNVKNKAKAMLIHTFLAQALSPRYQRNHYHHSLYRWHILDDRSLPNPGKPPYYSTTFFSIIKDVHLHTPLNIAWITVKDWYRLLQERGVTHTSEDPDAPPVLVASKLEENNPQVDITSSYALSRKFGLSPDQKSFIFKMLQSILPTRERLYRIGKVDSPICLFCNNEDTTNHLLSCPQSSEVTLPLIRCLENQVQGEVTPKKVVLLDIPCPATMELPLVWLVSTCLMMIWVERQAGRTARLVQCQAELQARLILLKNTKWKHYTLHNSALLLEEMINLHFN